MGAPAGGDDGRHYRAPARVGTQRGRRFLVGVGVLGPGVRRTASPQGGPGTCWQPTPTGATRSLQAGTTVVARPRRAQQVPLTSRAALPAGLTTSCARPVGGDDQGRGGHGQKQEQRHPRQHEARAPRPAAPADVLPVILVHDRPACYGGRPGGTEGSQAAAAGTAGRPAPVRGGSARTWYGPRLPANGPSRRTGCQAGGAYAYPHDNRGRQSCPPARTAPRQSLWRSPHDLHRLCRWPPRRRTQVG
jgi:hypothetical protein